VLEEYRRLNDKPLPGTLLYDSTLGTKACSSGSVAVGGTNGGTRCFAADNGQSSACLEQGSCWWITAILFYVKPKPKPISS